MINALIYLLAVIGFFTLVYLLMEWWDFERPLNRNGHQPTNGGPQPKPPIRKSGAKPPTWKRALRETDRFEAAAAQGDEFHRIISKHRKEHER